MGSNGPAGTDEGEGHLSTGALDELASRPLRFGVGLMSGSSCDGVDAALVRIKGTGARLRIKLIEFKTFPYPDPFKVRLLRTKMDARDLAVLSFELGDGFAKAAMAMKELASSQGIEVDFIASHGHTLAHVPPHSGSPNYGTLQIGEPAAIASLTGLPVISDFRPRDMAAGGQGAPLAPYADWVLFRRSNETVACLNIGGIANITVVTPELNDVIAFDTGPGNMPIDGAMRILTRGRHHLDWDGANAAKGKVIEALLEKLLDHPYLRQAPPKSTGREEFGESVYLPAEISQRHEYAPEDVLATVTRAVARSIAQAHQRYISPLHKVAQLIVSGGGARNLTLMKNLREELPTVDIRTSDQLGLPGDAREAIAFAILGNEFLCGTPANVPGATGARRPVVLGRVTQP
ncbi:MAG: anhydro-N-acetylmuramic acid kinase [Candidatus Hydrogenedentota bacterium]